MADVFISYSRENGNFARSLTDRLSRANKDSWVDWEDIPLTAPNWWQEIKAGIENADNFIFIMSPASMASIVCNMELDYAFELNKRVVPVVYQEIESHKAFATIADYEPDDGMIQRLEGKDPLIIARDNWKKVGHINWVFFRDSDDFEEAFKKLIEAVETDLKYVKEHTRYLTQAKEWERKEKRNDLLLFGEEIDVAEAWLVKAETYAAQVTDGKVDVVNPLADELHYTYIRTSRKEEDRRARILRNFRRSVIGAGSLAVVLLIAAVIAALRASDAVSQVEASQATLVAVNRETQNRIESERMASLVESELDNPEGEIDTAALLSARALLVSDTGAAFRSAWMTLEQLTESTGYSVAEYYSDPEDVEWHVELLPNGYLASWDDRSPFIHVWSDTGEIHTVIAGAGAIGLSGDRLLTWGSEMQIWTLDGQLLHQFNGNPSNGTNWSPATGALELSNGNILSWGRDETLRLWSSDGESLNVIPDQPLIRHQRNEPVLLDSGGFMSRDSDGRLHIWSAEGEHIAQLEGDEYLIGLEDEGLLVWGEDKNLYSYDVTGDLLVTFSGHEEEIVSAVVLQNGLIVSGGDDGTMRWWRQDGTEIRQVEWIRRSSSADAHELAVLDNGVLFAITESGGILWSEGGDEIATLSATNKLQALALDENSYLFWNYVNVRNESLTGFTMVFQSGEQIVLSGHWGVQHAKLLHDGHILTWGTDDDTIRVWSPFGDLVREYSHHTGAVVGVYELSEGQILSWAEDASIRLWTYLPEEQQPYQQLNTDDLGEVVDLVSLSNDTFVSIHDDGFSYLWTVEGPRIGLLDNRVLGVRETSDNRLISWGSTIKLWSLDGNLQIEFNGVTGTVLNVVALSDGRWLAQTLSGELQIWSSNGQLDATLQGYTDHGIELLSGDILSWRDDTLQLWSSEGRSIKTVQNERVDLNPNEFPGDFGVVGGPSGGAIDSAKQLPDGRIITWGNESLTIQVWTSQLEPLGLIGHPGRLRNAVVLEDGRILSWSDFSTLYVDLGQPVPNLSSYLLFLWSSELELQTTLSGHTFDIIGARQLIGGQLLTWSDDNTLRIWNQDGLIVTTLSGHQDMNNSYGVVDAIQLSNGLIASWAVDDTIRIWHIDGTPLATLNSHSDSILGVLQLSDGRIVSWSEDNSIRIWSFTANPLSELCERMLVDFSQNQRWLYGIPDFEPTCSKFAHEETSS